MMVICPQLHNAVFAKQGLYLEQEPDKNVMNFQHIVPELNLRGWHLKGGDAHICDLAAEGEAFVLHRRASCRIACCSSMRLSLLSCNLKNHPDNMKYWIHTRWKGHMYECLDRLSHVLWV